MERPIFKPVGTPVEELDTPALVVDLTVLERNIETMHAFFRQRQAKVRPYVETHCCPAIAHKQLAAGGTAAASALPPSAKGRSSLSKASATSSWPIRSSPQPRSRRLCALARHARITVSRRSSAQYRGSVQRGPETSGRLRRGGGYPYPHQRLWRRARPAGR